MFSRKANIMLTVFSFPVTQLDYNVDDWSLRIAKKGVTKASNFPRVIRLHYRTKPSGRSLMWRNLTKDFKTKRKKELKFRLSDCVFTPAANINNRSLFPCQEPPITMATWQAIVKTSDVDSGKLSYDKNKC